MGDSKRGNVLDNFDRNNWWEHVKPVMKNRLDQIWIPIGGPGFSGEKKGGRQSFLDEQFGPNCWRISHYVRGRIVSKMEAIREYEHSYRLYLRSRPHLVEFLTKYCGNVYDDQPSNVYDYDYDQPHTIMNHYQDISVRRVIAELVDDPTWPQLIETEPGEVDLIDLNDGKTHHVPRARGFRGDYLLQIREPDSPGFFLNPAVVPIHDSDLIITNPNLGNDWYLQEGCGHLSVESFWQMSKVIEVRYDKFLMLKEARFHPLAGFD